jgi:hypothetical protein
LVCKALFPQQVLLLAVQLPLPPVHLRLFLGTQATILHAGGPPGSEGCAWGVRQPIGRSVVAGDGAGVWHELLCTLDHPCSRQDTINVRQLWGFSPDFMARLNVLALMDFPDGVAPLAHSSQCIV